jgi:sterol desaturase/sphingolipid hydroxylase (fatty acid hydroxylase superfamily)
MGLSLSGPIQEVDRVPIVSNEFRVMILVFMLLGCIVLEQLWPLRKSTQPKFPRVFQNLLIAGSSALILRLAFYPIVGSVALITEAESWGILSQLHLPLQMRIPLALLSLDWTLYLWHRLMHKTQFLWRFHNVHHTDLDLDTSTALRFHFGELTLSAFYRSAQIVILGISPWELMLFELAVTTFAQFHHSNIRLPSTLDRLLKPFIMTPKMHGIHHSIVQAETDSNFGTILSLWDRLHGTYRRDVPQEEITIGVPSYRDPRELTFLKSLVLPFQKPRVWELPDGTVPTRSCPDGRNETTRSSSR